jgi:hypothetical protein
MLRKRKTPQAIWPQAFGSLMMGGRVIRQMDTLNTRVCAFFERMGFFYLPEVIVHEIIALFWNFQCVCSFISILYFCPVMGNRVDNIYCIVLGHECRTTAYPLKTKG